MVSELDCGKPVTSFLDKLNTSNHLQQGRSRPVFLTCYMKIACVHILISNEIVITKYIFLTDEFSIRTGIATSLRARQTRNLGSFPSRNRMVQICSGAFSVSTGTLFWGEAFGWRMYPLFSV